MLKRIRVHQLRIGMFVEELEEHVRDGAPLGQFLVKSASDLERMAESHAMSVIINTQKGADTSTVELQKNCSGPHTFDAYLRGLFSGEQIALAKKTVQDARPFVRSILTQAHYNRVFEFEAACQVVDNVMSDAMNNAGALIAVSKLKDKDEGTFLHSLAVSALMITFGRNLGLPEDIVHVLGVGGLVHDLGKMVLPVALLQKPGKLTGEEMALIRTHPQRGHEIVKDSTSVSQAVLDICLCHHEKVDGSGYPHQLSGDDIPLVARICAICDVYEALTTVRPYKRAWTQAQAIDTMVNSPGHFDPDLMKAFVSKMITNGTIH